MFELGLFLLVKHMLWGGKILDFFFYWEGGVVNGKYLSFLVLSSRKDRFIYRKYKSSPLFCLTLNLGLLLF